VVEAALKAFFLQHLAEQEIPQPNLRHKETTAAGQLLQPMVVEVAAAALVGRVVLLAREQEVLEVRELPHLLLVQASQEPLVEMVVMVLEELTVRLEAQTQAMAAAAETKQAVRVVTEVQAWSSLKSRHP
jgi:hypothetical protein